MIEQTQVRFRPAVRQRVGGDRLQHVEPFGRVVVATGGDGERLAVKSRQL